MTANPVHSWRVLILPYLAEDELYSEFAMDRSWNHPENVDVSYQSPAVFRHPTFAGNYRTLSAYYLVTGPNTLFPPEGPLGPADVGDSPGKTVLVVEGVPTANSGQWTEPIDLDFTQMKGQVNSGFSGEPGGLLEDGAALVTVDGVGHFASEKMPPATFRALVTPNGGERLPDDVFD
ncbi:MAG: DUF1559 domain-containing protein, partial [Planctomycetota bacterium]